MSEIHSMPEYTATVEQLRMNRNMDHDTVVEVVQDVFPSVPDVVREAIIFNAEQELDIPDPEQE